MPSKYEYSPFYANCIWFFVLFIASIFRLVISPLQFVLNLLLPKQSRTSSFLSNLLQRKYNYTSFVYDLLDYPWENIYQKWRPIFVEHMKGSVVEIAVGTGRNLAFYSDDVEELIAVDISPNMIQQAKKRVKEEGLNIKKLEFRVGNAIDLHSCVASDSADWVLSTFLFCVLPNELQLKALQEIHRILKVGGKFRLVEINFSKISKYRAFVQWWYSPFVEWMYGAKFDRKTVEFLNQIEGLKINSMKYVSKLDTHLLIEGEKVF